MSVATERSAPLFVYDQRYIEPEIQLLVLASTKADTSHEKVLRTTRMNHYKPTGVRTPSGLYEYELVEETSLD